MEETLKLSSKNKYGQYFTPKIVAEFMIGIADLNSESKILEPACGEGVFLNTLQQKGYNNLTAFEIDKDLSTEYSFVSHNSFVSAKIEDRFDLVIGNPPYIRWKNLENELKQELLNNYTWNNYFNALCDYLYIFILKSIELLKENGQLIFICPEYWMNTTHSKTLRNFMIRNGYFEEIYHFNETPIFNKVTVSLIIFKYIKSKERPDKIKLTKYYSNQKLNTDILSALQNKIKLKGVEYLQISQFKINENWLLQSDEVRKELLVLETACRKQEAETLLSIFEEKNEYHTIGEICNIGNGLVSGLDKAFQINKCCLNESEQLATLDVVKAKNLKPFFAENISKYIFINENISESELQIKFPNFFRHFQNYKLELESRYQYNRKINYWEWVFLRNFQLFNKPDKRIFVPCKERISNKSYFRFALIDGGIFPTQDVTAIFKKPETLESIEYILAYLNQPIIFDWLKCNGIVKGNIVEFSEKPISSIPFRKINWNKQDEVLIHDKITQTTKKYLLVRNENLLDNIRVLFNQLFKV
jgi:adenine-specific DNA-methyltransferase